MTEAQALATKIKDIAGYKCDWSTFDADVDRLAAMAQPAAWVALSDTKPLDDPRLQQLFGDAIEGALAFGYQGENAAPPGHWLERFWHLGRAEAEKTLAATPPPVPACAADDGLGARWISGHAIEPDWPVIGGEQCVVSVEAARAAIAAERAEVERLRAVVGRANARCDHLGMRLGEVILERNALRAFANGCLADWPDAGLDGFELQELAAKHGLLHGVTVTESCGEHCNCISYYDGAAEMAAGVVCYRKTALLTGAAKGEGAT